MARGHVALLTGALLVGIAIALVDASPGWDSTGITAGSLALVAAVAAGIGGNRPWLWALAVGLPVVVLEVARDADPAIVLAIGFAAGGAVVGWAIRRSLTPDVPRAR